jgi:HD-GYP domain-containing protein (c-di-GMP phosphodiesterase class II)
MKFSDILKKKAEDPAAPAGFAPSRPAAPAPSGGHAGSGLGAGRPAPVEEPDDVVDKRVAAHALKAMEIYEEAVNAARAVYKSLESTPSEPLATPKETLFKIVAALESGNPELLALADRSTPDNYLYGHAANVTILSVRLGQALKLSHDDLHALALGAFLHDIGMVKCLPLALKAGKLTEPEMALLRQHSAEGQKLLAAFPGITGPLRETVQQVIGQEHERAGGAGYPGGRPAESIHPFAKIVGACDVYEAVTHPRPWRGRTLPHTALRLMIEEHESAFDPGVVKSLIEALSLYPPGSFVKLSSGEIGRVISLNPGLPTRPQVKLLLDARGSRLPGPKNVNLALQPILYIADAVDETQAPTPDQRLLLELRAQRWWVKGL